MRQWKPLWLAAAPTCGHTGGGHAQVPQDSPRTGDTGPLHRVLPRDLRGAEAQRGGLPTCNTGCFM